MKQTNGKMEKKSIVDFLSALEGYHSLLKTIHWSTTNKPEHLLTDDIDEEVLEFEDRIAEEAMGKLNTRINVGELKTLMPDAKELGPMLTELENDIIKLMNEIGDAPTYCGMINILEEFMEKVSTWNYLRTLK